MTSERGPENKVSYMTAYPKHSMNVKGQGYAWEFRHHGIRKYWRKAKRRKSSLRDHRN